MSKANIEKAIKMAVSIDESIYYKKSFMNNAMYFLLLCVVIIIEVLINNSIKNVVSIRSYVNKHRGYLEVSGSV